MNRLESIKERVKKHRETEHDTPISNHYQFVSDVEYLLQRLERYEEALKEMRWKKYSPDKIVALAEEALKDEAIQP